MYVYQHCEMLAFVALHVLHCIALFALHCIFNACVHVGLSCGAGAPCSMKDGSCLTDRKSTHMEAHGSTLILTVDDEPTNHLVIEEIVTSQGYQVQ